MTPLNSWLVTHPSPQSELIKYLKAPAGWTAYLSAKELLDACCTHANALAGLNAALDMVKHSIIVEEKFLVAKIEAMHTVPSSVVFSVTDKERSLGSQMNVILHIDKSGQIERVIRMFNSPVI